MYESMYIYISDGFSIVLIVYVCGCPFFLLLFLGSTNAFSILHYFFATTCISVFIYKNAQEAQLE